MKKLVIGVSSLLMTLAGAEVFAQNARAQAARQAGQAVRSGQAGTTAARSTVTNTARGAQINGQGAVRAAGGAATTATNQTSGDSTSLTTSGASRTSTESSATASTDTSLSGQGRAAIATSEQVNGNQCYSRSFSNGQRLASGCDSLVGDDKQLVIKMIDGASSATDVEGMARVLSSERGQPIEQARSNVSTMLAEGKCIQTI